VENKKKNCSTERDDFCVSAGVSATTIITLDRESHTCTRLINSEHGVIVTTKARWTAAIILEPGHTMGVIKGGIPPKLFTNHFIFGGYRLYCMTYNPNQIPN